MWSCKVTEASKSRCKLYISRYPASQHQSESKSTGTCAFSKALSLKSNNVLHHHCQHLQSIGPNRDNCYAAELRCAVVMSKLRQGSCNCLDRFTNNLWVLHKALHHNDRAVITAHLLRSLTLACDVGLAGCYSGAKVACCHHQTIHHIGAVIAGH